VQTLRTTIARFLIALALIVQIIAPVGSSVAMVIAATDPLVDIIVCAHDFAVVDRQGKSDPAAAHHGDACGLCQLVAGGGFAPPPEAPIVILASAVAVDEADWARRVEPVAAARLLDHIRGRAPPRFS
jgi:hypothetical protein